MVPKNDDGQPTEDDEDGVTVEVDENGDGQNDEDGGKDDDAIDEEGLPDNVKALLKKQRDESRAAAKEIRQLKASARKNTGAPKKDKKSGDDGDEPDIDELVERKSSEIWKPRLVNSAARAAFAEAGASSGRIARLVKMLDLDELEVDDKGEVDGLDEQIEEIKDDFPELFETKQATRRTRRSIDAGSGRGSGSGTNKQSASERQAARLLGK